jgi:hypothetical protein
MYLKTYVQTKSVKSTKEQKRKEKNDWSAAILWTFRQAKNAFEKK